MRFSKKSLFVSMALLFACFVIAACNAFPESSFELANESRLPVWFSLPAGLTRADISVTMNYFIKSTGGSATFVFRDKKHRVLMEVTGTLRGSSPMSVKSSSASDNITYPLFEVITAQGATEVIEHRRMEPTFYITDDPGILRALLHAPQSR